MLGEKFEVNGKFYEIKKELKLGEYRRISGVNSRLNKISQIEDMTPQQASDFTEASNEQLQVICDFLESHLGVTQSMIDDMDMKEAINVFQEAFKRSTTPDKDIKKT